MLSKLEASLQNSQLNKNEINTFLKAYSHYKVGRWVYPGAMHRLTKIPVAKIYDALDILEKQYIVKSYFEIVCTNCKHTTAQVYETIDIIPNEYFCDECGHIGNATDGAILIYKVICDD
jgi:predicted transcriptional regulator|nr:MAG TPA: zinc-ribbon domain protein [Caudoviricetes sp.]